MNQFRMRFGALILGIICPISVRESFHTLLLVVPQAVVPNTKKRRSLDLRFQKWSNLALLLRRFGLSDELVELFEVRVGIARTRAGFRVVLDGKDGLVLEANAGDGVVV